MMDYLFLMSLLLVSNDIISPIKESKKKNIVMETICYGNSKSCTTLFCAQLHLKGLSLAGSRIMLVI